MYHKSWSYAVLYLRYGAWRMELCFILGHFLPFYPLTAWKIKIKKNEKKPGDNITLQKCTKNHDHILYFSWHMANNVCNCYFSFCVIFCRFTSLKANRPKNSNSEKTMEKTRRSIIILQKCAKNYDQMMYSSWDDVRRTDGRMKKVTYRGGCPT